MPSFQSFLTAILGEEEPEVPDLRGLYGYNIYNACIRLQGSDIPVTVAHYTRERRLEQGVLARIIGSGHTSGSSFLIVAISVKPVSFLPIPGPLPKDYDLLARIVFSGVVTSEYAALDLNADAFSVDITVDRPDAYPSEPMVFIAVFNRDAMRLKLNAHLDKGANVYGRGVVCGWSKRGVLMVDVHHIEYNGAGGTPKHVVTDPLHPFRRIELGKDGWPSRDKPTFPAAPAPTWDVMSFSSTPTRVTQAVTAGVQAGAQSASGSPPGVTASSPSRAEPSPSLGDAVAVGGLAAGTSTSTGERAGRPPACRCGATRPEDCSARLITGWKPSAPSGDRAVTGDAAEDMAVAALLALKSTSAKAAPVTDDVDGSKDDGESRFEQSSVDPRIRTLNVTPVQGGAGHPAVPLLSVEAVRRSLKRKAPFVAGCAMPANAEIADGSVKRPRVKLHVTAKLLMTNAEKLYDKSVLSFGSVRVLNL